METPGKIPGYAYNEMGKGECNWRKAWALVDAQDTDPFIILLANGTLWVVPHHMPEGTWGSIDDPSSYRTGVLIPKPIPDTSKFIGPFESFDLAFATFTLMVTE